MTRRGGDYNGGWKRRGQLNKRTGTSFLKRGSNCGWKTSEEGAKITGETETEQKRVENAIEHALYDV